MPRSALAAYPERPLPHDHPAMRTQEGHLSVAPLPVRLYKLIKAASKGAGNPLVLGLEENLHETYELVS